MLVWLNWIFGAIKMKENKNSIYQMGAGYVAVALNDNHDD